MAPQLDGMVVADIGCGTGAIAELVLGRARPAELWCVDPDDDMVAAARRRLASRATVVQGRAEHIARVLPQGTIDVAFLANCVHLVEDLDALFRGLQTIMRPGGQVLISTAFFDRGALPEDGPLYRRLVLEAAKIARRTTGERRTRRLGPRPLAKRQLSESLYRDRLNQFGHDVTGVAEVRVELTGDLLLRIASSPMFASGALPSVEPELAVYAVTKALREFPGFDNLKVTRRWLYVTATSRAKGRDI